MFKERNPATAILAGVLIIGLAGCTGSGTRKPSISVPGQTKSSTTQTLETGSALMQTTDPLRPMNIYLVGFHPMKDDPSHQMEAHHFCTQQNEDFAQCALFDGNTTQANLNGIEYIISEQLFEQLPEQEKQYWHPHNGEILSGQLVAPGLPKKADHRLMESKMNSYGKTWHTWDTNPDDSGELALPVGEPSLAWSFNRFGQANRELVEKRDRLMGIKTDERRKERQDLLPLANPQRGVDAMREQFPEPTRQIPGVVDESVSRSYNTRLAP